MLLLVLSFLLCLIKIGETVPVLDGKDVVKGKYPFMAYLQIRITTFRNETMQDVDWFVCGGVIITEKTVLTAAHCLSHSIDVPRVIVKAGMSHLEDENAKIAAMIDHKIHDEFIDDSGYKDSDPYLPNDIALIWLNKDLTPPNNLNLAAKINDGTTKIDSKTGVIIGWGLVGYDEYTDVLQEGRMNVISNEHCAVKANSVIVNEVFCAMAKNKKTAPCIGDSGGPFIINDVVVGISSWSAPKKVINIDGELEDFCDPLKPSIFVRLDKYFDWIQQQGIANVSSNWQQHTVGASAFPESRKSNRPSTESAGPSCKKVK